MQAPRQHRPIWRYLARGAALAFGLVTALPAIVEACIVSPLAKPGLVEDSVVEAVGATAWYSNLSDRYRHGVLGDALEPTGLHILTEETSASCGVSVILERPYVFEDLAPRLFDFTRDGVPELVTIRSHERLGAQIAIYGMNKAKTALEVIAETPHIGTANRWLAPAGIGDLDGDGALEIAFVDRPHLAKTLRVWRYENGALREIAALGGVTNHRIGEDFITGGLRDCGAGPEMVLAEANWRNIVTVRLRHGELSARRIGVFKGQPSVQDAMRCN